MIIITTESNRHNTLYKCDITAYNRDQLKSILTGASYGVII